MTTEGTTRAEAAAHILARETGRRMRAVQTRIDEVEEERKIALDAIASRLVDHEQTDERHSGLIDGLRLDLGTAHAITAALDVAHGETRDLTAAQALELVSIAERLAANEQIDSAQDAELTGLTGRIEGLELRAPVPGPPGPKGPPGPSGRVAYGGGGGSATIQSAGTLVANRPILNFVSGATVADDATNNRVNITVSGGGGNVNSVSVSSGLSITGTSDLTITNTGVRSLAGSGISVSDSTGAVTITAPTVTGGTGITVAGSGTTTLTVSATGVNSVSAGTGISVSGTTALTVSATGVQSLTAGNGITVSGTTTPTVSASLAAGTGIGISGTTTLSVSNTGVTSIVAGTGISVSGATGAVTVTSSGGGTPSQVLLGTLTVDSGSQTTVSVSSIPATYKRLLVYVTSPVIVYAGSSTVVYVRLNGDAGANYYLYNTSAAQTVTAGVAVPATGSLIGTISPISGFSYSFVVENYTSSNNKTIYQMGQSVANTTAYRVASSSPTTQSGLWISSAVVTMISLVIVQGGASFPIGFTCQVHGVL
jgi:hypothetical protein